jgi:hypothetical protein
MENLGVFYDHLVYFTAIGNILLPFGIFVVIWYIFPRFGILDQEKSGNPALVYDKFSARLPDGLLTFQNSNFGALWKILESKCSVNATAIWYNLRQAGM